jgi:hypothetical protein
MLLPRREVCTCGHGGHRHLPKLVKRQQSILWLPGLGTCGVPGCSCEQFRFWRWARARKRMRQASAV